MLTSEQIGKAAAMLAEDATPEQIAQEFGFSRSSLIDRLKESGYRIRVRRELEPIIPVPMTLLDTEEQPRAATA